MVMGFGRESRRLEATLRARVATLERELAMQKGQNARDQEELSEAMIANEAAARENRNNAELISEVCAELLRVNGELEKTIGQFATMRERSDSREIRNPAAPTIAEMVCRMDARAMESFVLAVAKRLRREDAQDRYEAIRAACDAMPEPLMPVLYAVAAILTGRRADGPRTADECVGEEETQRAARYLRDQDQTERAAGDTGLDHHAQGQSHDDRTQGSGPGCDAAAGRSASKD